MRTNSNSSTGALDTCIGTGWIDPSVGRLARQLLCSGAALSACLLAPLAAHADQPATVIYVPAEATPIRLKPVEVTRVPTKPTDVPDLIVITRQDIDLRQAVTVTDVLRTVPGVAVADNGAFGGVTTVRMRGASADKTLVLIDGLPQNDPSDPNGAYDFASLDLSDIQRIEILEGPQSSLWGSAAIGGVISLTSEELDGWRARAEGGSLASFDGSAAFGRRTDRWAFGASIFGDRSDGVAKADGIGPRNPYWSASAGAWGRVTPTEWLTLDGHLRYQRSYAGVDGYDAATFAFGYTPQYYRTEGWSGVARAIVQAPLGFTDTLSYGLYDLRRTDDYIGQPFSSSRYTAQTQDWRFTAERGAAIEPWGIEFGAERHSTDGLLSTGQREGLGTTSGFAVVRLRPAPPLTLSASARYDAPDNFAGSATGHVSAVLTLPKGFQLEAAWGQGFKTPTISEIACDFCFPAGPALNLRPEHALGWDGALAWTSDDRRFTARLTGYRLAVNDQIAFSPSFPFRYVNLSHTRTTGLEAEASAELGGGFTLSAEYAYTDALDVDARTQLLRVPRNAGSATLGWTGGRWTASFTVRGEGPDADENPSTFAPQRRPGFVVADAAASYALTPKLDLTARVTDLANRRYEEVLGYGEPRQMFFVGLRAKG